MTRTLLQLRSSNKEEQQSINRAPAGTEAHIGTSAQLDRTHLYASWAAASMVLELILQIPLDTTMSDAWPRIKTLLTPEEQDLVLSGKYRARIMK